MSSTQHFRRVTRSDVLRVAHETIDTLEGFDAEALALVLDRTAHREGGEAPTDIHHAAAALLEGLLSFHPFALGTEEIARRVVTRFYEINGWTLRDDVEVAQLIADMSSGQASGFAGAAVLGRCASRSS